MDNKTVAAWERVEKKAYKWGIFSKLKYSQLITNTSRPYTITKSFSIIAGETSALLKRMK